METLIMKTNKLGAYPPIMNIDFKLNEGIEVCCDTSIFYKYNGFVIPIIENNKVVGFTPNTKAWEAWKASVSEPEPQTPELTKTQKLQLAVAELGVAAAQSKTEVQLAIAELAATMTGGTE